MATYEISAGNPAVDAVRAGDVLNLSTTGVSTTLTLPAGRYRFYLWGGSGGDARDSAGDKWGGGRAGAICGTAVLDSATSLTLFAAGYGQNAVKSSTSGTRTASGGAGGGGNSGTMLKQSSAKAWTGGGGGGCSWIRQGSSYLLVAGGGGGACGGENEVVHMGGSGALGRGDGARGESITASGGGGGTLTAGGVVYGTQGQVAGSSLQGGRGANGTQTADSSTWSRAGGGGAGGYFGGAGGGGQHAGGGGSSWADLARVSGVSYPYADYTAGINGCPLPSSVYGPVNVVADSASLGYSYPGYIRIFVEESLNNLYVKQNGVFVPASPYVRQSGVWVKSEGARTLRSGMWEG